MSIPTSVVDKTTKGRKHRRRKIAREAGIICLLVGLGLLTRFVFVFCLSHYTFHLVSDMGGYWHRAMDRFNGNDFELDQWAVWPPFYHIVLAYVFDVLNAARLRTTQWLPWVLGIHVVIGSASIYAVYGIACRVLRSRKMGIGVGILYALTYPLIYMSSLLLSENLAMPLFIIAVALVVRSRRRIWPMLVAGALAGVAVAIRPAYLPCFPAFILACLFVRGGWRSAAAITAGFAVVVLLVCHEDRRISRGQMTGLSANGGVTFFIVQAKLKSLKTTFQTVEGATYVYEIGHPEFADEPLRHSATTNIPFVYQAPYYRAGFALLRSPQTWVEDFEEWPKLFFGIYFPVFPEPGYTFFDPIFKYTIAWLALIGIFGVPLVSLARMRRLRPRWRLWFIWSLVFCTVIECFFFGDDRRLLYSLIFAAYVSGLGALTSLWRVAKTRRRSGMVGTRSVAPAKS